MVVDRLAALGDDAVQNAIGVSLIESLRGATSKNVRH